MPLGHSGLDFIANLAQAHEILSPSGNSIRFSRSKCYQKENLC